MQAAKVGARKRAHEEAFVVPEVRDSFDVLESDVRVLRDIEAQVQKRALERTSVAPGLKLLFLPLLSGRFYFSPWQQYA
jgi:hypothetical protein